MIDEAVLRKIIRAGVQAPSGDNSQPWIFKLISDGIGIFALTDEDNPALNVRGLGTYVSAGAVIINISIAASAEHLQSSVEIFPADDPALTARVRFSRMENANDEVSRLADTIPVRHTNRKAYHDRTIPLDLLTALVRNAAREGVTVRSISDATVIRKVADAASTMELVALADRRLHRLFFRDIYFDAVRHERGATGFHISTLELPPPVRVLFRILRLWPIARFLGLFGFPRMAATTNADVYAKSSAYVMFAATNGDPAGAIAVGSAMEQLWLDASRNNISVQPVSGLLYLNLRANESPGYFGADIKALITEQCQRIYDAFDIKEETPLMLLRLGYAEPPTAIARRRSPEVLEGISSTATSRDLMISNVLRYLQAFPKGLNDHAVRFNISFFQAIKTIPNYVMWLWRSRHYANAATLLEINEILPELDDLMHEKLTTVERQPFPGMLRPPAELIAYTYGEESSGGRFRCLDIGAGAMELERQSIQLIAQKNDRRLTFVGIDRSSRALDRAEESLRSLNDNRIRLHRIDHLDTETLLNLESSIDASILIILASNDIEKLGVDLAGVSFDIACSCLFMHHVPPHEQARMIDLTRTLGRVGMHYDGYHSTLHLIPQSFVGWQYPIFLNAVILSNIRFPTRKQISRLYDGAEVHYYKHGHYRAIFRS